MLQKTMGWRNTHLHEWIVDGRRYGEPVPDEPHYQVEDETDLTLRLVAPVEGVRFEYLYDFGDGWRHEIVVERIDSPGRRAVTPLCLGGERACLPRIAAARMATGDSWRRSGIVAIRSTRTC
ncbi:MAG TPA: plasmid pRiA4b ORF-3 family protein [Methylomirabilota bacterium]|nr:plasmid pRiA4b ORF-3 family protein [Methylomirabilota bacterium]